jgi:hypothetical protein
MSVKATKETVKMALSVAFVAVGQYWGALDLSRALRLGCNARV